MFTVSVCSLKGGVGKTSVTLGLASAALHQGVSALIIDLDPQGDTTLGLLGEPADGPDIAEVISSVRRETVDRAIQPTPWSDSGSSHLDIIPGSHRSSVVDSPTPSAREVRRLREALSKRTHQYDLVLIDCPPSLNGLTQMALAASDRALVVCEPGFFAVTAADRALKLTEEMRDGDLAPRLEPLGLLVNRYRPRSVEHQYRLAELRELFGELVLSPVIEERVGLQQAQGGAVPLHLYEGASGKRLTKDFDALLRTVLTSRPGGAPAGLAEEATGAEPTAAPGTPPSAQTEAGRPEEPNSSAKENARPRERPSTTVSEEKPAAAGANAPVTAQDGGPSGAEQRSETSVSTEPAPAEGEVPATPRSESRTSTAPLPVVTPDDEAARPPHQVVAGRERPTPVPSTPRTTGSRRAPRADSTDDAETAVLTPVTDGGQDRPRSTSPTADAKDASHSADQSR